mmetsp:Transcript_53725/g.165308  ORF Transcript_53725/g.165308 Transcript_53725/m.165308 type:complete len:308 (+) Transcript_53725:28-951(+)
MEGVAKSAPEPNSWTSATYNSRAGRDHSHSTRACGRRHNTSITAMRRGRSILLGRRDNTCGPAGPSWPNPLIEGTTTLELIMAIVLACAEGVPVKVAAVGVRRVVVHVDLLALAAAALGGDGLVLVRQVLVVLEERLRRRLHRFAQHRVVLRVPAVLVERRVHRGLELLEVLVQTCVGLHHQLVVVARAHGVLHQGIEVGAALGGVVVPKIDERVHAARMLDVPEHTLHQPLDHLVFLLLLRRQLTRHGALVVHVPVRLGELLERVVDHCLRVVVAPGRLDGLAEGRHDELPANGALALDFCLLLRI